MNNKLILWLEARKVIFETFAASLLALMAVVVSIAQSCSAQRQTELLELQTRIAQSQVLPQISAVVELQLDTTTGRYDTDTIRVENHGGLLRDVSGSTAAIAELEIVTESRAADPPIRCSIALNGYYDALAHSPQGTGQVLRALGSRNNGRFVDLGRDVRALASERGQYADLDLERYLRIQYSDLLGETHSEYFHVRPIYGGALIAASEGAAIFASARRDIVAGEGIEFSDINAVDLLDRCSRKAVR